MRLHYRHGGKGTAPEGFDRVYTEVDGDGNVLRELLAYVRAGDSVTMEMGGELGGTAGAFVEMALALYRQQATLLCKSPKIDTAAGHWQAVLSDLALLTGRNTDDAARLSRFMEELHRCFDPVERRQMTVAEVCRKMSIGKTTYYRYTYLHCSSASDDSRKWHGAVERLREEYPENVFASAFELPAFSALASLVFQNQGLQIF